MRNAECGMRSGGQILVDCLKAQGVRVIFGFPGSHVLPIYDALYDEPEVRHVLARDERGVAFMADGYARATGEVGVCLTTAGPGATNASTGIGTSYSDSVPVLLVTGQVKMEALEKGRGAYHEMDLLSFLRPITKWNGGARGSEEIPGLVVRAFEELRTGRPRPVHVEIPIDVQDAEARVEIPERVLGQAPRAAEEEIERAARLLRASERPILIAGRGAVAADAAEELIELSDRLRAPIVTSRLGKGAVSEDHPAWLGIMRADESRELLTLADCALAVGCRFTEVSTYGWRTEIPRRLVQIDLDPEEIGKNYPAEQGLVGDAKAVLRQLVEALDAEPGGAEPTWWPLAQEARQRRLRSLAVRDRGWVDAGDLRAVLDRDAILSVDICMPGYAITNEFPVYASRSFLYSSNFIAMGYGLPAAIGAQVAFPDRQVVSISGDGGFLMTCGELATAVKYDLPLVAVVASDNCLGSIKRMQVDRFPGRHVGVDLYNPDFVRLAESFGATGIRVDRREALRPALERALGMGGTVVIEVRMGDHV